MVLVVNGSVNGTFGNDGSLAYLPGNLENAANRLYACLLGTKRQEARVRRVGNSQMLGSVVPIKLVLEQ